MNNIKELKEIIKTNYTYDDLQKICRPIGDSVLSTMNSYVKEPSSISEQEIKETKKVFEMIPDGAWYGLYHFWCGHPKVNSIFATAVSCMGENYKRTKELLEEFNNIYEG